MQTEPTPATASAEPIAQDALPTQHPASHKPTPIPKRRRKAKAKPQHGGARTNAGRKPKPARKKLGGQPAYVSLATGEKARLEAAASKHGLSVSSYIRVKLGFPAAT